MSYVLKAFGKYYIGHGADGSVWKGRHYFAKRFGSAQEWRPWVLSNLNGFAKDLDHVRVVRLMPKGKRKK